MALATPYCTIDEATDYLGESVIWEDAELIQKNNALFWGRVYLDSTYSCAIFDETDPPDEIKYANALLAEDWLDGSLIDDGSKVSGSVKMKRVKAGSVESETEYRTGTSGGNSQDDVDKLLSGLCKKKGYTKFVLRV
ncbi:MAG: hypothetical protein DRN17_03615 [Thermoplasmata archaeon]|nr:MAG: hypothetical protein DRN17_03615 [Thermoplasmata archaeon]